MTVATKAKACSRCGVALDGPAALCVGCARVSGETAAVTRVEIGRHVLYCGDALAVLPTLDAASFDIVLTDPPYRVKGKVELRGKGVAPVKQTSTTIGNQGWTLEKGWLAEAARICQRHIVAFGNYLDLPELLADHGQGELRGVFTWLKPNAPLPAWNVPRYDTEFAVWFGRGSNPSGIRRLRSMVFNCPFPAAGCFAYERLVDDTGKALHPAQKPLQVMRELVEAFTEPDMLILDPFMGSATTLVACERAGRRCVGIERDSGHFALACKRLTEAVHSTPLFPQEPALVAQAGLFDE